MSISIVIPFHNEEKTICRCIDAIIRQKIVDLQIVLVNDHSTDNTVMLCEQYVKNSKNIMLVNAKGVGVSAARNTGLKYVTNEIIGFCDADDYFAENVLPHILQEFTNPQIKMVIAGYYKTTLMRNNQPQSQEMHLEHSRLVSVKDAAKLILLNYCVMGSVWNKFYRKSLIHEIDFDESLSHCEDMHFNCEVLQCLSTNAQEKSIRVVTYPVYHYVANPNSVTNLWENLFDYNGELKYITALSKIESIDCIPKKYIRYKKFCLAIDTLLSKKPMTEIRKMKLDKEIKENCVYFFLCFMLFPRKNSKILIRWLSAL